MPCFVTPRVVRTALLSAGLTLSFACQKPDSSASEAAGSAQKPEPREAPSAQPGLDMPPPADVNAPPADAKTFANGVASKVLKPGGGGEHPADNDCVRAHFSAWKRDGSLFSSSRAQKTPELTCLRTSIEGLREPLEEMSVGEARRVWVPGNLTFVSSEPDEPAPNVDLTFDVELVDIVKGPEAPPDLNEPPKSAKKTRSGVRYRVLSESHEKQHPSAESTVRLRFTGFTRDGAVFESTELSQRPTLVALRELPKGLSEGIEHMVVGEKTRFWIPAELAYGEKPQRRGLPAGALVYDVELLAITKP
jgi:peptidylprolyl isomerase